MTQNPLSYNGRYLIYNEAFVAVQNATSMRFECPPTSPFFNQKIHMQVSSSHSYNSYDSESDDEIRNRPTALCQNTRELQLPSWVFTDGGAQIYEVAITSRIWNSSLKHGVDVTFLINLITIDGKSKKNIFKQLIFFTYVVSCVGFRHSAKDQS